MAWLEGIMSFERRNSNFQVCFGLKVCDDSTVITQHSKSFISQGQNWPVSYRMRRKSIVQGMSSVVLSLKVMTQGWTSFEHGKSDL